MEIEMEYPFVPGFQACLAVLAAAGVLLAMTISPPSALAASNKLSSGTDVGSQPCVRNCPVEKLRGDLPYRAPPKPNLNPVHCHYVGWGGHKELVCD